MPTTEVTRVITFDITRNLTKHNSIILGHLTYSASKLWNVANYAFKKQSVKLYDLKSSLKDNFWYRNLHSQSSQAVIEKVQIAWKNYFGKHTKPPRFQPKDGHLTIKWKKNGIRVVNNSLRLSLSKQTKQYLLSKYRIESKYLWIGLPKNLSLDSIQEVEIVPHHSYGYTTYIVHVIHKKILEIPDTDKDNILAIDLGVKNLAVATDGNEAKIFDGRYLLSQFRKFVKSRYRIQSTLSKQKCKVSRKMHNLVVKERNFTKDYTHKVSRAIVNYALELGISEIVFGDISNNVSNINIGKNNNEKLHRIPIGKLIKQTKYKAKELGINVRCVNESYTSQTCSSCGTIDRKNRIYRGLYKCNKCGTVLNSDVNGALNILKSVSPTQVTGRSSGLGQPLRIYPNYSHKESH